MNEAGAIDAVVSRLRAVAPWREVLVIDDGPKFLVILLKVITLFSPLRIFGPVSLLSFLAGAAYGLWNVAVIGRIPNGAVLLILFAVAVFLAGLVSEQVWSLRFGGPSRQ